MILRRASTPALALALPAASLAIAVRDARVVGTDGRLDSDALATLATVAGIAAPALAMAALVLARSSARAAVPLAWTLAASVGWTIDTLCGAASDAARALAVVSRGMLPAALAHLVLTFPRPRPILGDAPRLPWLLYVVAAAVTAAALADATRAPQVTALAARLSEALCAAAWLALAVGCALVRRESRSALDRARASLALGAAVALPTLSLLWVGLAGDEPDGARVGGVVAAALLPLPVGYAVVHYRLFDLGRDLRRAAARLSQLSIAAAALYAFCALLAWTPAARRVVGEPEALFAAAFAGAVLADATRGAFARFVARWAEPDGERLGRLVEANARTLVGACKRAEVADRLCEAIAAGLGSEGVVVHLHGAGRWRPAAARGSDAALASALARPALGLLVHADLVHLAREEAHPGRAARALRARGIELVGALRIDDRVAGVVLVAASGAGRPCDSGELGFVRALLAQAATALHRAELTGRLVESESFAAIGRLGAHLAHDLGKPLGVIELRARALARGEPAAAVAHEIATLAAETRRHLRGVVDAAGRRTDPGPDAPADAAAPLDLDRALDRAVRSAAAIHGPDRIALRRPPELTPAVGCEDSLVRALTNLLDNALLAGGEGEVVELVVTDGADAVSIEVIDRGVGMSEAAAARAFESFYSARGGGSGLGLPIARELVESMGGAVALESAPGSGTRVQLALRRASAKESAA